MKKIGYCLIGCGRISKSHLPAIASLKGIVDFVATVDTDRSKAEEAAKNFGARKVYTSIEEALLDPEIEAVDICLPHHLHEPVAVQAANHKKHILIEKPLARNLEEADRIIESAEKNGVKLMVGQSRRFTNAVFESKRIVERGAQGISNRKGFYKYTSSSAGEWEKLLPEFTQDIYKLVEKYEKKVKL